MNRRNDRRRADRASYYLAALFGLMLGLLVLLSADVALAKTYAPPAVHYCVDIGQAPGRYDLSVVPKSANDRDWVELRYLTHDGKRNPGAWRGTGDLHTPDYQVDLEELGYDVDVVAVRDAYCGRDSELQQRARAVRMSGEFPTPFEPGFSERGARNWDVTGWEARITYNRRALQIALGADADLYIAVVRRQINLAIEACDKGTGVGATPAAGAWQRNAAGACRPTSWRWGRPDLDWARPVRIELPPRELGRDFRPGRLSTGWLSTEVGR